ncbi:flagellar biosynthetic protein FliR [Cellulomonas timonensis]|uniref:flagellar biosynthetic protein FliR n=1 Tax=Cellulomonas timonensis TaxID=1689271 RepID=UPI000A6E1871|nr:flagellar biosynthetic protein FliR [Cellulomonas timonensis]
MGPLTVTLPLAMVELVMLAGVRVAAFLVIAPPFANSSVPGRVKAMLAVGLALAMSPRLEPADGTLGTGLSTAGFVGALFMQVLIGGALGFLVALVFAAVQGAGTFIDLFGGFQMAAAFDPMSMTSGAQFARLYQFTAVVLLFASDGHQMLIAGLARTFDALPIGAALDLSRLGSTLVDGTGQMFVAALQIAGPLIVVLFLTDVGLGLLTRVSPAMNAFALGFPLKILMTLTFATFAYLAMPGVIDGLLGTAVEALLGVVR